MRPRVAMKIPTWLHALTLASVVSALAAPVLAQDAVHVFDSTSFKPIRSSARSIPDIVNAAAQQRHSLAMKGAPAAHGMGAADRAQALSFTEKGGAGTNYNWGLEETWLPDLLGIQWCVSGYQSVRPVGGVKLYEMPSTYGGLRTLQPWLIVTLDAEEQLPAPHPHGSAS